jgi:Cu-processing system permease protein
MSILLPKLEKLSSAAGVVAPLLAVLLREFRAAFLNRYVQVFSVLALAGGVAAIIICEESGPAVTAFLLQIALYFVSLLAVLIGVSSARAEAEEWPILCAQPAPRWSLVAGKFIALATIFSGVVALLDAPALFTDVTFAMMAKFYFQTLALGAVFGSLGLCAGFLFGDRVQALIVSISAWLFLLVGGDLLALAMAPWPALQKSPDLWVAMLMLNPLDAFRIQALFALEQIPAEAATKTPVAQWWITHAGLWMTLLATAWTTALLFVTIRRFEKSEV